MQSGEIRKSLSHTHMTTIRLRATLKFCNDFRCLFVNLEDLSGVPHFNRDHLWVGKNKFECFKEGSVIEFTGDIHRYGKPKYRLGIRNIRNIKLVRGSV